MDFEITEEQKQARAAFRNFLEREIAPVVDEREQHGPFSREEVVQYIKKLIPFDFYLVISLARQLGIGNVLMDDVKSRNCQ